jgi:hypothetical protein
MIGHPLLANSINPEMIRNQIDHELYESCIPKKEDVQIRLPWRISCKLAVLAYMHNLSFSEMTEHALLRGLI